MHGKVFGCDTRYEGRDVGIILPQVSGVKNTGLHAPVFRSLPLGAVQPTGMKPQVCDSCFSLCM